MPTFAIDFITPDGPKREQYSLDDDRPVGPQIHRVLAELRERGVVLSGGRDDVLSIEWNGMRLDESQSPAELGIKAVRPLELRMRARERPALQVHAAPRVGLPQRSFVPAGVVSTAIAGAL